MAVDLETGQIKWLDSLDDGLAMAKKTGRVILLDFFNPG
jgi:hypothetical protein